MTIKVYISGICGSHEVRKQQQRVLFILQSLPIDLKVVDITEPGREEDLTTMQEGAKKHHKKTQLPPQIFNDDNYCGDYADFEMANDDDQIMRFLKLESAAVESPVSQNGLGDHKTNGVSDALEENNSDDISENNVETEKNPEIDSTENEVKDSVVDDSNKEEVEEDKKELSKGASQEEESE